MTLSQVSVFCGDTATCDHTSPKLIDDVSCNDQRDDAHTTSFYSTDVVDIAGQLAALFQCDVCLVLSCLDRCNNQRVDLQETMHVVSATSTEERRQSHALCIHSRHELIQLALEQSYVVISNDPANDPRGSSTLPSNSVVSPHSPIASLAIVPLILPSMERLGAVVLANVRPSDDTTAVHCRGFNWKDIARHRSLFVEVALVLASSYWQAEFSRLQHDMQTREDACRRELATMASSRDTFIATMSHEIRTPLTAINGYNEILMKSRVDEFAVNCLRQQREAIVQLTHLIANILDFSKLKSDNLKLDASKLQLRSLMTTAIEMVKPECEKKGIAISLSIAPDVPDVVLGDKTRLYQIVSNLINNSVKFTSHGFIELRVYVQDHHDTYSHIRVDVRDSGRGVPKRLQKIIFEDFRQIRDSLETYVPSLQGVGLGLAICRELVRLMDGRIWVESDGHTGSTFSFVVKLRDGSTVDTMVTDLHELLGDRMNGAIIVDDMSVNRVVLTRMMAQWNFMPHAFATVEETLDFTNTIDMSSFSVAIIDMDIGGDSGVALARRLYREPKTSHLVLIAASSLGTSFAGASEFDAVHEKPIRPDDLLEDIIRLVSTVQSRGVLESTPQRHRATRRARGNKILIVDDDAPSLAVTKEMLTQIGYSSDVIDTAANSRECLTQLHECPSVYACVFMDLVMPGMDGIECIRRIIKHRDMYGEPYIVALTADAVDATRTAALNAGASEFLIKPVSMRALRHSIANVLPLASSRQPLSEIDEQRKPTKKTKPKKKRKRLQTSATTEVR